MVSIGLLAVFGYLVGSIPFGLVLTRLAGAGDIRQIGSGNIGATNVLRTGRKGLALATLLLDGAKGALVVGWALWYGHGGVFVAGLAAFLGHLFPVWLGFKGGKGVATGLGLLLVVCWQAGAAACAVWLIVAAALRYSSAAALTAFLVAPIVTFYYANVVTVGFAAVLTVLVFWTHRANIARLRAGTETRIGQKAAA
jgi:glycerol-3-phosphate acyltransferase PlsY